MHAQLFVDSTAFAVIRFKQEYETLAVGFDDCFQQINAIIEDGVIEINYGLKFFMCCDYKVARYINYIASY